MRKLPIYVLAGPAGSGKSTAGEVLSNYVFSEYKVVTLSFADPIKEFVQAWFGGEDKKRILWGPSEAREGKVSLDPAGYVIDSWVDMFNPDNKVAARHKFKLWLEKHEEALFNGVSARWALQQLGTEVGRAAQIDVWARQALNKAQNALMKDADVVVIPDGRFRNEIVAAKSINAQAFLIWNDLAWKKALESTHQSERELTTIPKWWYDKVVDNSLRVPESLRAHMDEAVNPFYPD